MLRARKVDEYYDKLTNDYPLDPQENFLQKLFRESLTYNNAYFFSKIWVPILETEEVNGVRKLKATPTYYNCGLTPKQISDLYWTKYSGNYLVGREQFSLDYTKLCTKITAVFYENLAKYLKLIELYGYYFNPLWNVDGTELRQIVENDAEEIIKNQGSEAYAEGNSVKHNTFPYDSETAHPEWEELGVGNSVTPSATTTIGEDTATSTTNAVPNTAKSGGSANSSVQSISHGEIEYSINASDTAFGVALSGGDRMHTEKLVRQGNIGVTKSTELITDARNCVRFSIIQEFFKDINKVILIGLYDN